jgi:hypothetical protein
MSRLPTNDLPDFKTTKMDMLTAARLFKTKIDKVCKEMGMDPEWETSICLYKDYTDSKSDKIIVVNFEAGPFDWGVSYSLGSNPKSYNPMKNPNDWYLECHYGFDVLFTPHDFDTGKSYKAISLRPGPNENMKDKMDIVEETI